jgi:hypothetical protein
LLRRNVLRSQTAVLRGPGATDRLPPVNTARPDVKVLTYVPEIKDLTILDGWAVEWRNITGSYVEGPGGEPNQIRGTVLGVYKKLPDGRWRAFRAMGTTE